MTMNSEQNFLVIKIGKLGIQEVERPDNASLIREEKGLILKHGKFPLPSNLAKGNLFH